MMKFVSAGSDANGSATAADNRALTRLMRDVLYALIPATLLMIWYFGWGMIINLLLAVSTALVLEGCMLLLRKRPLRPFLSDYSAVISGWLLALCIPAFAPWWLVLVGVFFAIVMAKQLYGGLGYNPFNPAMVGFAVLLISFPVEMVNWFAPLDFSLAQLGLRDSLAHVFLGASPLHWDGMTMATPLDVVKTGLSQQQPAWQLEQDKGLAGLLGGSGWERINLAYALGGCWLIYRKVISWVIPLTLLAVLLALASGFWLYDMQRYSSPLFHLLSGGTLLCAFFIATDPVSASTTPFGKILYATGIGLLIYIIRVWGNSYPDGVAFAVLLMNIAAPSLDTLSTPRTFGTAPRFRWSKQQEQRHDG